MKKDAPLAVLADIHGNSLALGAVLADAKARGISRFANLGDIFYGPLDPAGTWAMLKDAGIPAILGNQDRILLEGGPAWEKIPAFRAALDGLGHDGMAWLRSLPKSLVLDGGILLTHGTPRSDTSYLLEDVATGRPVMRPCADVVADILPEADDCTLVLAGHSHFPGRLECGGRTVVNPGSVGLPAYDDDTPPHAMSAGTPHARYAIVRPCEGSWDVEFVSVEYDWNAAARMAAENGRADWAKWLGSGVA